MKICYIADSRSPIAQNWIRYFISKGHDVHIISSYPCTTKSLTSASFHTVPVAFSGLIKVNAKSDVKTGTPKLTQGLVHSLKPVLSHLRHWFGPLDVRRQAGKAKRIIEQINPDLVHAMRIPFEGMLAAEALRKSHVPLLVSIWGNDFTLHTRDYPFMAWETKRVLDRANAMHPDCQRDLHLAHQWGYNANKLSIVLPSSGGVQADIFYPGEASATLAEKLRIPKSALVVLNPRGFRGYVHNDTFFKAIPHILARIPNVVFLCLAMKGNAVAEKWINELKIGNAVRLLPFVSRSEMAGLFRLADITVSPSKHDGTPNTLLEAMACGCFPIAGNIESVREWIEDGVNGLLSDSDDPKIWAEDVSRALQDASLRTKAKQINTKLISQQAEYSQVMAKAERFYQQVVGSKS